MFSVFATSYRLRITYRVNSIIYSLKQLPLVRRLLPSALYRSRGLKRFACVIAILMEILGMFLQKGAYLGIVVLAPVTQLLPPDDGAAVGRQRFVQDRSRRRGCRKRTGRGVPRRG